MTRNRLFLVLLAAIALVASPAWAVTAYNTTGFPSVDSLSPWTMTGWQTPNAGANAFEGFGVVFTAPTVDTILNSFNIFVNAPNSGAGVGLVVAGWNGGSLPDLNVASNIYFSGYGTLFGQNAILSATPNVTLQAGQNYVAFVISLSSGFGDIQQRVQSLAFNSNVLGTALWNLPSAANINGGTWSLNNSYFPGFNATFINTCPVQTCALIPAAGTVPPVTITPPPPTGGGGDVPEPSTYVLLGSALLGLSILRRRS